MTSTDTDEIFELIGKHAIAWARFGRACGLTDEQVAKEHGRKVTTAQRAEYEAANQAEEDAYRAILGYQSVDVRDIRTKALWIRLWISIGNALQDDEVDILITSMIEARR